MAIKARGQITIVDLNDGRSLNMYLSANQALTQIYNPDAAGSYTPDYTANNLVITPQLFVSGASGDQIAQCSKGTWAINGSTSIEDFGGTQGTASPYALTINKNMVDLSQMRIEYTTVYTDPDTTLETTVKANINLVKVVNAGSSCVAVIYAPNGSTISKTQGEEITSVKLHCDLWRGSKIDSDGLSYQWSKRLPGGSFENLVDGTSYSGVTTNEVTIQASGVDNFEVFKCTIIDTKTSSPTYGQSFPATMTVVDATDPYSVEILSTTGNVLTKTATSTKLTANIWQNGSLCSDTVHASATYQWTKYDQNGANGQTAGTTREINVDKSDISVRATYVCLVTI